MERWQHQWNRETRGRWTAKLIPQLNTWINRKHGVVNYYLTQFLSGHGYFQSYLHKMKKVGSPECKYCGAEYEDAEHTFFDCDRWAEERAKLKSEVGHITPGNVIDTMLQSEELWDRLAKYVEAILRQKKKEEILERLEEDLDEERCSRTPRRT